MREPVAGTSGPPVSTRGVPRRGLRAALAVASVVLLLTGCVGIPTTGGVQAGRSLVEQDEDEVRFFPLLPAEGASQENILRGFVAAFSGLDGDYEVARAFLSEGFADEWDPRAGVTVRDNVERFAAVDADTMSYTVNVDGAVDATGVYRETAGDSPATLEFEFVQEGGQWRISAAPDGTVLAGAQFRSIFDEYALYFLDPTRRHLVPDARWFETGAGPLQIVSALLEGVPARLAGAVDTAFPAGTRLTTPSVDVASEVATIDLSAEALTAEPPARQLMRLQLESSLGDVAGIERVEMSVGGAELRIPSTGSSVPSLLSPVDARAVVFRGGAFGYLSAGEVTPIDGLAPGLAAVNAIAGTVDVSVPRVVALGTGGVYDVVGADAAPALVDARPGLIPPTLDEYGAVWSATAADAGSLRQVRNDGTVTEVPTGYPDDVDLVSIDASTDGTRMLLALDTPAGARTVVRAIVRDASTGVATGLGEPLLDAAGRGDAVDATWVDPLSVASLTSVAGVPSVTLLRIGGIGETLGTPVSAVALVGGNGESGLRALTATGTVTTRSGNSWTEGAEGVVFLAAQR